MVPAEDTAQFHVSVALEAEHQRELWESMSDDTQKHSRVPLSPHHAIKNALGSSLLRLKNTCSQVVASRRAAVRCAILDTASNLSSNMKVLADAQPLVLRSARQSVLAIKHTVSGFLSSTGNERSDVIFANMAKIASEHLHQVVTINGQLVLSGMKVSKEPFRKLQESEIRSMFQELDTDQNGLIEPHEFLHAFKRMGLPANTEYLRDVLSKYSTKDCMMSYDQYKKHIHNILRQCHQSFVQLGEDGTGVITEENLLSSLRHMGMKAERDDAQRMIRMLDVNCDQNITFAEFCRFTSMLPRNQLNNKNVGSCWADSADQLDGIDYRLSMVPGKTGTQRALAGGLAGAISKTLVAPLERLRTIVMASPSAIDIKQAWTLAWADGGALGMFKGNTVTVLKAIPGTATKMASYDHIREYVIASCFFDGPNPENPRGSGTEQAVAGALAGLLESTVCHPLETIRTIMQVPGTKVRTIMDVCSHPNQGAREAWKSGGMRGLYAGFGPSVTSDVIGGAIGFTTMEGACKLFERIVGRQPGSFEKMAVGSLSTCTTVVITMPLEVIQRRMQVARTSEVYASFKYRNVLDALVKIIRREGVMALYRGSFASYAKNAISIGVMYGLYDLAKKVAALEGIREYKRERSITNGGVEPLYERQSSPPYLPLPETINTASQP